MQKRGKQPSQKLISKEVHERYFHLIHAVSSFEHAVNVLYICLVVKHYERNCAASYDSHYYYY